MNDIAEAMTMNLFPGARNGWEHTGRLLRLLERAYISFEDCSYSDTRGEYDITFIFEDTAYRFIGGCGDTLEFHSIGKSLGCGWSLRPDPLNVETIAYQMIARLRGEKIDYRRVLPSDLPFSWYKKGEPWPWRDGPDCQLPPLNGSSTSSTTTTLPYYDSERLTAGDKIAVGLILLGIPALIIFAINLLGSTP